MELIDVGIDLAKGSDKTGCIMKYKGFVGIVQEDEEEGGFNGRIINTKDLVTFEADSVEDIEKEFKAAVDDYIKLNKGLKRDPGI